MKNTFAFGLVTLVSCTPTLYLPSNPQYDRHNQQILFQEQARHPRRASATYTEEGIPLIKYDPKWMRQFPKEFQDFVIYHEVAHLKLGHVDPQEPVFGGASAFESQADCHSLRYLKYGLEYSDTQLEKVLKFVDLHIGRDATSCLPRPDSRQYALDTKTPIDL